MTNFEKIKDMSIEEFARFLCLHLNCGVCMGADLCKMRGERANGLLKWLEQEVEE